jgi:tRNA threonylcarbamoyladenosine biosynthesis protein TsaB
MRALAIDTSTEVAGVALCDGTLCVARTPIDAESPLTIGTMSPAVQGQHAERLLGIIDEVMQRASWKKGDLELIACCIGPGSFTGVRVGVATAKGIALGLGLPIVGVGSLEAMAFAHRSRGAVAPDGAVVPLLDARKGEIFWAAYGDDGALIAGPGHLGSAHAADLGRLVGSEKLTFVGQIAPSLQLDPACIVRFAESDRPDPAAIACLAEQKLASRGPDDLDALEPTYVRPPDITLPATSS